MIIPAEVMVFFGPLIFTYSLFKIATHKTYQDFTLASGVAMAGLLLSLLGAYVLENI